MGRDDLLLWLLVALLAAAVALTLLFAPQRSRHGYGVGPRETGTLRSWG